MLQLVEKPRPGRYLTGVLPVGDAQHNHERGRLAMRLDVMMRLRLQAFFRMMGVVIFGCVGARERAWEIQGAEERSTRSRLC